MSEEEMEGSESEGDGRWWGLGGGEGGKTIVRIHCVREETIFNNFFF